jgi:hypothetical protein
MPRCPEGKSKRGRGKSRYDTILISYTVTSSITNASGSTVDERIRVESGPNWEESQAKPFGSEPTRLPSVHGPCAEQRNGQNKNLWGHLIHMTFDGH